MDNFDQYSLQQLEEMRARAQRNDQIANALMPHLISQESGGQAGISGPQTKYGRAIGATQLLPSTAKNMAARAGVPYQPELLKGTSEAAKNYQHTLGREYLIEGLEQTGNVQDALKYYHGGPNRKQWGPKTRAYASDIMAMANRDPQAQTVLTSNQSTPSEKNPEDMSLAELEAEKARLRDQNPDGYKYVPDKNANMEIRGTGHAPNSLQTGWYANAAKNGDYDPMAKPGTLRGPMAMQSPNDFPDPGQWYVDLGGKLHQMGATKPHSDEMFGAEQSMVNAGTNIGKVLPFVGPAAKKAQENYDAYVQQRAQDGVVPGKIGKYGMDALMITGAAEAAPAALGAAGVSVPAVAGTGIGATVARGGLTAGRLAAEGAAGGAATSEQRTAEGVRNDALAGAGGALAFHGLLGGAARALNPRFTNQAAKDAADAGIKTTLGQNLGPIATTIENGAKKVVPLISGAQRRATDSYGIAAVNDTLKSTGLRVPKNQKTGEEALAWAQDQVRQRITSATDPAEIAALTQTATKLGIVQDAVRGAHVNKGNFTPSELAAANNAAPTPDSDVGNFANIGRDVIGGGRPSKPTGIITPGHVVSAATGAIAGHPLVSAIPVIGGLTAHGPVALGAAAMGAIPYTPAGQSIARAAILGDRPQSVQAVGDALAHYGRKFDSSLGGATATNGGSEPSPVNVSGSYVPVDQVQTGLPKAAPQAAPTDSFDSMSLEQLQEELAKERAKGGS